VEVSREPSVPYFRAESQSPSVLWVALTRCGVQIGTTKGTGGDVLILEEAAYCDEGFFYETVAPILSIGSASLVAISTLTSEINFYTRLIQMIDPATERPLFAIRCIELCCDRCKAEGKQIECVHMLHLVPMWQSEERHRKLKIMMQDRPDLIQSELAGLAFDSLQQVCTVHTRARPKLERTMMPKDASPRQKLNSTLYTARSGDRKSVV
jgi:hypothetical protein